MQQPKIVTVVVVFPGLFTLEPNAFIMHQLVLDGIKVLVRGIGFL